MKAAQLGAIALGVAGLGAAAGMWVSSSLPTRLAVHAKWATVRPAGLRIPESVDDLLNKTLSLEMDAVVENRNLVPLDLFSVEYTAQLQGARVARGRLELPRDGLRLASDSATRIRSVTSLSLPVGMAAQLGSILSSPLRLRLLGTAMAGLGPMRVKRDFELSGVELRIEMRPQALPTEPRP